jgi:hypothetical protein
VIISNEGSTVATVNFFEVAITGGSTEISIQGHAVVTFECCEITGNTNQVGNGGGIANVGGTVKLVDCSVTSNTSGQLGGGMFTEAGSVTLSGTTVSGNTAGSGIYPGGGIYNLTGTVTLLDGSTVSGNTPDDCVVTAHSRNQGSGCASIKP